MAVGTQVSVEEYLHTSYRPDCDYVDGDVQERNLGEFSHGRLQLRIGAWFLAREARLGIKAVSEVRLQVNPHRFRVPDLMVLAAQARREEIVTIAPILCIEILSKSDSLSLIWERIEDYFGIGVAVCWIIDPVRHLAWTATPGSLVKSTDGILRSGDLEMPLAEILE
jgi:Uma2 family endonuclease